jgi:hypothetical protein
MFEFNNVFSNFKYVLQAKIDLQHMKKGYLFVLLFALFIAVSRTYYHRAFVARDLGEAPVEKLVFQAVVLFTLFALPGLLLARWYYKQKNKIR